MANLPWINNLFTVPEIWGGLSISMDAELNNLRIQEFQHIHIDLNQCTITLSDKHVWAGITFSDTEPYGSVALFKLIEKYPQEKIKLIKIALIRGLDEVWQAQDETTKTAIMAEMLGSKHEG